MLERERLASAKSTLPTFFGRGMTFDQSSPAGLFVPSDDIKVQCWDLFAPVWGTVIKYGCASQFDEVTYAQMLDDLKARNLRVYMDQDHRTARFFNEPDIPSLAFYCGIQVNHLGKEWRRENLAGHTCADAVSFDVARMPEGMAGFRCAVTPTGKQVLPNYQALSIHFDPAGEDHRGHPVGQSLICVSAVNGPHLPGAVPQGGAFSRRHFDMKNRKPGAFGAGEGGAGGDTAEAGVEMEELRTLLKMPEGASDDAVLGAAIAVLKASQPQAEPDGDEAPIQGDTGGDDAEKLVGDLPDEMKGYARKAVQRWSRGPAVLRIFAKELGVASPTPAAVVRGLLTFKAKSVPAAEHQALSQRIAAIEAEGKEKKQQAWDRDLKELLDAAGPAPVGQGLISGEKRAELEAQARKYSAPIEDVRAWLPKPVQTQLSPAPTPSGGALSGGGAGKMVGSETAEQVRAFREAFTKETGKQLRYEAAASIVTGFARKQQQYSYAAAKAQAERLGADSFISNGSK